MAMCHGIVFVHAQASNDIHTDVQLETLCSVFTRTLVYEAEWVLKRNFQLTHEFLILVSMSPKTYSVGSIIKERVI